MSGTDCVHYALDNTTISSYSATIADVTAFGEIVFRMKDPGFDFSKVILVTDRGYQSLINIQKQIDLEVKFHTGHSPQRGHREAQF